MMEEELRKENDKLQGMPQEQRNRRMDGSLLIYLLLVGCIHHSHSENLLFFVFSLCHSVDLSLSCRVESYVSMVIAR